MIGKDDPDEIRSIQLAIQLQTEEEKKSNTDPVMQYLAGQEEIDPRLVFQKPVTEGGYSEEIIHVFI